MHFILSVSRTTLREDISAFVHRYPRPCPQISLIMAFHASINSANGQESINCLQERCPWEATHTNIVPHKVPHNLEKISPSRLQI